VYIYYYDRDAKTLPQFPHQVYLLCSLKLAHPKARKGPDAHLLYRKRQYGLFTWLKLLWSIVLKQQTLSVLIGVTELHLADCAQAGSNPATEQQHRSADLRGFAIDPVAGNGACNSTTCLHSNDKPRLHQGGEHFPPVCRFIKSRIADRI
jgi:hypothetical protein